MTTSRNVLSCAYFGVILMLELAHILASNEPKFNKLSNASDLLDSLLNSEIYDKKLRPGFHKSKSLLCISCISLLQIKYGVYELICNCH